MNIAGEETGRARRGSWSWFVSTLLAGVLLYFALRGHKADVRGVVFSRDGQLLVTAGHDNLIKVWELKSRRELLTLRGHKSPVNWVAFTPDERTLVSAADDGLRLWNVATWRQIGSLSSVHLTDYFISGCTSTRHSSRG